MNVEIFLPLDWCTCFQQKWPDIGPLPYHLLAKNSQSTMHACKPAHYWAGSLSSQLKFWTMDTDPSSGPLACHFVDWPNLFDFWVRKDLICWQNHWISKCISLDFVISSYIKVYKMSSLCVCVLQPPARTPSTHVWSSATSDHRWSNCCWCKRRRWHWSWYLYALWSLMNSFVWQ